MCTNLAATAQQILEAVADRSGIEQNFHDLKEIEGAGQQQSLGRPDLASIPHRPLYWSFP